MRDLPWGICQTGWKVKMEEELEKNKLKGKMNYPLAKRLSFW
jgi:hypothetical protein